MRYRLLTLLLLLGCAHASGQPTASQQLISSSPRLFTGTAAQRASFEPCLMPSLYLQQDGNTSGQRLYACEGSSFMVVGSGGVGGASWGGITGTLSAQTDLQNALNAKLDDSQATSFGLSLLDDVDAASGLATLGAQPLDTDLTSLAALSTTAFGRGILDDADAAAGRVSLDAQQLDADLTSIAALTTTSHGRGLLDDTDAAASRASISAQAAHADLDNIVNNCVIENDSTPIPDACVGDGSDAGGGGGGITYADFVAASLSGF